MKKITLKQWQVSYINYFLHRWEISEDSQYPELTKEWNQFREDNGIPEISADELLTADVEII